MPYARPNLPDRKFRFVQAALTYLIIAAGQLSNPAAAADPASKIDPPGWSYVHSQEEIEAYGQTLRSVDLARKSARLLRESRLRERSEP